MTRILASAHIRLATPSQVLGFEFRVSGFGPASLMTRIFESAHIRFRVSDFGLRVSGLGLRVEGFGFRVYGSGFRVSGFGFRTCVFDDAHLGERPHQVGHPLRREVGRRLLLEGVGFIV